MDDGEAATIAIALNRDLPLVTDDRKARRGCAQRGLAESFGPEACRDLLTMVRRRAGFLPPRADPRHAWWSSHVG